MTATAVRPTRAGAATGSRQLAGTGTLLRLALRRDRLMMPVWVLVVVAMVASMPGALESVYGTAAERADAMATMNANSSMRSVYGPVFGDSVGALSAWRGGSFAAVLAGVMSLVIVVRHTREEEETGRQETISAAMVGRRAPLTAALLAALLANAAAGLLIAGSLAAEGAGGALLLGLGVTGTGMLFATAAAVVAQLTESARLAKGMAAGVLGAAFVLRAAGDSTTADGSSVLTWLSPLGWHENIRPFAGDRWWVLPLFAVAVLAQLALAYELAGRRDIGMGFLRTRPGPASGSLATAGGLAWRLQRGGLYGWCAAFLVVGISFGGMAKGADDLIGGSEKTREIVARMGGHASMTDAFLSTVIGMLGLVAALYVVSSVLRLHGEETSQRAEPLLANAVGRVEWAAGHLAVAFGGTVALLLAGGVGVGLGYGRDFGPVLGAALVQVPAVWVIGGIAVLPACAVPRFAAAAWGVAGLVLAIGWVGPALDLPDAVLDASPYGHLPKLPGSAMEWGPVIALTALTAALVVTGLAGLRRRDMLT
ncbi:ABC transporter permease [Streptomyces sp. NPDC050504]|uniref:ABC transporter permease n=1 Tax=Streptomyces sp. NPDC050504 TaxID=3365618 RepID=UPI0037A05CB7